MINLIKVSQHEWNRRKIENMELQMKVNESFIILSQVGTFSNAQIKKIRKRLDKKWIYLAEGK